MKSAHLDPSLPLFDRLVRIMEILRAPGGCEWDREQTTESLRKFVLEEAQEVAEAIDEKDPLHICEELGDLLMLVVFHSQIARENGTFTIQDALKSICDKLISRHPHVFKDREGLSPETVLTRWKELKVVEKKSKGLASSRMKLAAEFSSAITAAFKVQEEAAKCGFDFPNPGEAVAKIREEALELEHEFKSGNRPALQEEIGDFLFAAINVARLLGVNPEQALRDSSGKFIQRFSGVESHFETRGGFQGKTIEEMDMVWNSLKKKEKSPVSANPRHITSKKKEADRPAATKKRAVKALRSLK